MEAVPRMPMLAFQLKNCPELISSMFTGFIKQQITKHYHEDGSAYSKECTELEQLREAALRVSRDFMGCSTLKKYYAQVMFVCSRMKMTDEPDSGLVFTWDDAHSGKTIESSDIRLEQAAVLYNIGALHSILGAMDNRQNPEGMKVSCTHFQCAAWAFQQIRDYYGQLGAVSTDMNHDLLTFQINLMLAQAQECILEKSMTDNRKSTITAKVAAQIRDYYSLALKHLDACDPTNLVGSKKYKEWKKRIDLKRNFHQCIVYYYQGCQVEDQQKWGERVAFFQASVDKLNESIKLAKGEETDITEALRFTMDVVGGKFNAAKKDNDFVYHDKIPGLDDLPEVKGAQLVKGIPFNYNDPEVSGPDIFKKLVPMKAHEAASLYSEEKAKLLRTVGGHIEEKDEELQQYQNSLQLDPDKIYPEHEHLPQILLEKCAAISVQPDAIKDLVASMQSLSNVSTDVEANISEILDLLEEDEKNAVELQAVIGKKSPDVTIAEIRKECLKYKEGLSKAAQSNTELHRAMNTHISNLKLLSSLEDLKKALPSMDEQTPEDEAIIQEMKRLMDKVEQMKMQRKQLEEQFRSNVQTDDITNILITREEGNLEEFFSEQLKKHDQLVGLIEQNISAQGNILRALTETNAKYANIRRQIQETKLRREEMVDNLVLSHDVYEDLLAKCQKGVEFYRKLELNVQRLLERTNRVCKSHDEERQQIMARLKPKAPPPSRPSAPKPGEGLPAVNGAPPGVPMADGLMAASVPPPSGGVPGMPPVDKVDLGALPDLGSAPAAPRLTLKDYLPFMKPATFGDKKRGKTSGDVPPMDPAAAAAAVMGASGIDPSMMAMYSGITGGVGQVPQVSMHGGSLPNSHAASPVHMPKQPASQPGSPAHLPQNNMRPSGAGAGYSTGYTVPASTGVPPDSLAGASSASAAATPYGAPTGLAASSSAPQRQVPSSLPTTAAAGTQPFPADHILSPASAPGAPSTRRPNPANQYPSAGNMASAGHPSMHGQPGLGISGSGSPAPGSIGVPPGGPSTGIPQHQQPSPHPGASQPQHGLPQATSQQQQYPQYPAQQQQPQQQPQQQRQLPQQPNYQQQPQTQQQQPSQKQHPQQQPQQQQPHQQPQLPQQQQPPPQQQQQPPPQQLTHQHQPPQQQQTPYQQQPQQQAQQQQQQQPVSQQIYGIQPGTARQPANLHQSNMYRYSPDLGTAQGGPASHAMPTRPPSQDAGTGVAGYSSPAGYPTQNLGIAPTNTASASSAGYVAQATGSQPQGAAVSSVAPTGAVAMATSGLPGVGAAAIPQTTVSKANQNSGVPGIHYATPTSTNQTGQGAVNQNQGWNQYNQAGYGVVGQSLPGGQVVPGQIAPGQPSSNLGAPGNVAPMMTSPKPGGPGHVTTAQAPTQQVSSSQVAPGQVVPRQVVPSSANPGLRMPNPGMQGHGITNQVAPGQTGVQQPMLRQNMPGQTPNLMGHPQGQFQATNAPTQAVGSQYLNRSLPQSSQPWNQASGLHTQAPVSQYNTGVQGIASTAAGQVTAIGQYPGVNQTKAPNQVPTGALSTAAVPPGGQSYNQNTGYPQNQTSLSGTSYPQSHGQQAKNNAAGGTSQSAPASVHPQYSQHGSYGPAGSSMASSQGLNSSQSQQYQQAYTTSMCNIQQQRQQQPQNVTFQQPPSAQQQTYQSGYQQNVSGNFGQQPSQQGQAYYPGQNPANANQQKYPQQTTQQQPQQQQPTQQQVQQPQFTQQMPTLPSPLQPSPASAIGSADARPSPAVTPNPPQDMTPKDSPLLQARMAHPAPFTDRASSLPPQANSTASQPAGNHRADPPNLYQSTSSSLDDILSSSPENSKDAPKLTPKVITEEDLRQQREEKMKNSLKQMVTKDPYIDQQVLNRFVSEVEKFEKLVEGLSKETLSGPTPLDKEWKELAEDQEKEARKHSMAIARCYPMKNRFSDIMPYDSTRVVLTGGSDDYINANHLGDLSTVCPKFIATQAPLPATMVDFWQMVYEQGTEVIVCLNQENEAGKKNHVYWPQDKGQTIVHGPYTLYLQSSQNKQEWVERILTLTHKETRQSRSVVHLQFLQWSPGGVPPSPAHLLQFVCEVHTFYIQQRNLVKPVVVHCSNGVDRTGAFCIIYTGIQAINQGHGLVNIPDLVRQLRQNRKYMVGEKELLRFCYYAVLYYGQDLLMKRGILTSRASFSDKLPAPGEKGHQRKPSEDFILGTNMNLNTIQSSVAKMTIRSVSPAASNAPPPEVSTSNAASTETLPNGDKTNLQDTVLAQEGQGQSHSIPQSGAADKQHIFDPFLARDRSRSGSTSSVQSHVSNQSCQGQVSGSESPSKQVEKNTLSNLPPSLADLQDPTMFKLEVTPPSKRKITKASFGNQTQHLADVTADPNDPLSSLDPLWTMKSNHS